MRAYFWAQISKCPPFLGYQEMPLSLVVILFKNWQKTRLISQEDHILDISILSFNMANRRSSCCSTSNASLNLRYLMKTSRHLIYKVPLIKIRSVEDFLFRRIEMQETQILMKITKTSTLRIWSPQIENRKTLMTTKGGRTP